MQGLHRGTQPEAREAMQTPGCRVGWGGDTEAGPQDSVGSRCVEMEGEGFPRKVLSGVMTKGHRTVGLQDAEKKQASGGGSCELSGARRFNEEGVSSRVSLPGSLCVPMEATLTNAGISPTCGPRITPILGEETVTQ